jgi:hypothetical protein
MEVVVEEGGLRFMAGGKMDEIMEKDGNDGRDGNEIATTRCYLYLWTWVGLNWNIS